MKFLLLSSLFFTNLVHANSCVIQNDYDMSKKLFNQISYMCSRLVANVAPQSPDIHVLLTNKLKHPNAFAFMDKDQKTILVTDQLLKMHDNDSTLLAFIFGHEIGHLELKHTSKDTFFTKFIDSLKGGALTAIKVDTGLIGSGVNLTVKGYDAKYSQSQELAADKYSYLLLIRSGYSKQDALNSLEILKKNHDEPSWRNFFATHPDPKRRIESIQRQ
jgi:Zn-dependent protease with chaperone function